jgi:surfactin synthase thioesterase subunit
VRVQGPWNDPPASAGFVGDEPLAGTILFCFPHAGGGAYGYRSWFGRAKGGLAVVGVQLPGHENRLAESLCTKADQLVDDLLPAIVDYAPARFAFFGHSMGALLAYEVARRLGASDRRRLVHFWASGSPSPRSVAEAEPDHYQFLDDAALIEELRSWGGWREEILESSDLLGLILPVVRADLEVFDEYTYGGPAGLTCPISVFAGENEDDDLTQEDFASWCAETTGPCTVRRWPGDHFYIADHSEEVLRSVAVKLGTWVSPRRGEDPHSP